MNLSPDEVAVFYKLMWSLQSYVNRRLSIFPQVSTTDAYGKLSTQEKLKVREALYARPAFIGDYLSENPDHLTGDELRLAASWTNFIQGEFYILRYLKRFTVFSSAGESDKVYGVLGLNDSIEEVLGYHPLPVMVKAVLLPFNDRIIYDGLLMPYDILFGRGIRGSLNEVYQRAKLKDEIIESLTGERSREPHGQTKKPGRDWRPEIENIATAAHQLKQGATPVQSRAFSILKASAALAKAVTVDPGDIDHIYKLSRRVQSTLNQFLTTLDLSQ